MDVLRAHIKLSNSATQFKPVSLPFGHPQLPELEPVDGENLPRIISDSTAFLQTLEEKHNTRIQEFQKWREEKENEYRVENRRLAPGYLDSPNHLLSPKKRD